VLLPTVLCGSTSSAASGNAMGKPCVRPCLLTAAAEATVDVGPITRLDVLESAPCCPATDSGIETVSSSRLLLEDVVEGSDIVVVIVLLANPGRTCEAEADAEDCTNELRECGVIGRSIMTSVNVE
jgi:hypothetical protein